MLVNTFNQTGQWRSLAGWQGQGWSIAAASGGDTPQATAFIARLSDHTWDSQYKTLINGLVSDGVFSKLDCLYVWATNAQADARLNLIQNAFNITEQNTPTWTQNRGYTGSYSTSPSLNTGFTSGSTNFLQDSACFGVWSLTAGGTGGNLHGALDGGATIDCNVSNNFFNGGTAEAAINIPFSGGTNVQNTEPGTGWVVGNRSSSSRVDLYFNGTSVANSTTATSASIASLPALWFLARNFGGSANQVSNEQVAAGVIGGSLSGTDHTNLYNRLQTFLHAVGAV